jgi:hypothetical protein
MHGISHFIDVTGTDAFLVVGKPGAGGMFGALKIGNQRMHAGGGEKTCGIIFGNQRGAADLCMAFALEKFDITAAYFFSLHFRTSLEILKKHYSYKIHPKRRFYKKKSTEKEKNCRSFPCASCRDHSNIKRPNPSG